jgi:hypothetical protein
MLSTIRIKHHSELYIAFSEIVAGSVGASEQTTHTRARSLGTHPPLFHLRSKRGHLRTRLLPAKTFTDEMLGVDQARRGHIAAPTLPMIVIRI